MARIVLGIGCSHTPQLHTPAELWEIRAKRDTEDGLPLWYRGERLKYADVADKRLAENLGSQTGLETRQQRLAAANRAIDELAALFARVRPDITVIFGNDQGEMFLDDLKPGFTIMGAESFENMPRTDDQKERLPPGIALADVGHLPDESTITLPGHPSLARHLSDYAIDNDFDVAFSHRQFRPDPTRAQTSGMPHSYGFVYKQIMREFTTPHVPIDTNTIFPPNQPRASRCYAFGRAIGAAIDSWEEDARVCVVASGGLSHFVVDEAFDHDIMTAMARNDFEHLLSYHEGYFQAGSSEIKSWIAAGGAMHNAALEGRVVDYQALYRTPGGTGSSAAFMAWE